jgi:hypothetical protein
MTSQSYKLQCTVSLINIYFFTSVNLSPIQRGFAPGFVNYKKGCTRLAAASDKVYQLLAQGRWFFPGTPTSSTTKPWAYLSEWLLFNVEWAIFSHYIMARTCYIQWDDDDDVRCVLNQYAGLMVVVQTYLRVSFE